MPLALNIVATFIFFYLLGAIQTAVIVGRVAKGLDIRSYGSGNAGGTNVFRILGWKHGVFVTLVDVLKGALAASIAPSLIFIIVPFDIQYVQLAAGLAATIGHIWPVFLNFKGGKGVGAAAGTILAVFPVAAVICMLIFISTVYLTRYISLASLLSSLSFPLVLYFVSLWYNQQIPDSLVISSLVFPALITLTHRENIYRLMNGSERKFGDELQNENIA